MPTFKLLWILQSIAQQTFKVEFQRFDDDVIVQYAH